MNHLNYCRQMVRQFTPALTNKTIPQDFRQFMSHCIDLARVSQKFILPDGGRLYDDPDYRALDESAPLSLPFPLIAVEYSRSSEHIQNTHSTDAHAHQPQKALLFARERDEVIAITVVVWNQAASAWGPLPEVAIPRTGYIDRGTRKNGHAGIVLMQNESVGIDVPGSDYMDEVGALLSMLNILQCNNVHVEKSPPTGLKKMKAAHARKALAYDSYHILTISQPGESTGRHLPGQPHRLLREHLRRGHIRRLSDGRKIWVNATVVAAGRGAGVVHKTYAISSLAGAA